MWRSYGTSTPWSLSPATIDRLWKSDDEVTEGGEVIKKGEWHQSDSFGRDDLLLVAKVADLCHTWIYRRIQDQAREQSF